MNPNLSSTLTAPAFPALKIAGGKALARSELIGGAEDRLVRVVVLAPDQLVASALAEAVRGEELVRAYPVVFLYRVQYVITSHLVPGHHLPTVLPARKLVSHRTDGTASAVQGPGHYPPVPGQ